MNELEEMALHARQCQISRDNLDRQLDIAKTALEKIANDFENPKQIAHYALIQIERKPPTVSTENPVSANPPKTEVHKRRMKSNHKPLF